LGQGRPASDQGGPASRQGGPRRSAGSPRRSAGSPARSEGSPPRSGGSPTAGHGRPIQSPGGRHDVRGVRRDPTEVRRDPTEIRWRATGDCHDPRAAGAISGDSAAISREIHRSPREMREHPREVVNEVGGRIARATPCQIRRDSAVAHELVSPGASIRPIALVRARESLLRRLSKIGCWSVGSSHRAPRWALHL
jgi:hypothetical protein